MCVRGIKCVFCFNDFVIVPMVYYYFFCILFFIYNYLMFEHKHVVSRHLLFAKNIICARKLLGLLMRSTVKTTWLTQVPSKNNRSTTTGATCGPGIVYPPEAHEFTPGFQWGSCCSIFNFFVVFCTSLFVLSFGHCFVCLSSIYGFWWPPFGILKLVFTISWYDIILELIECC